MIDISKIESKLSRLVEEDKIPKGIRQDILDSWLRCKKYKLDVSVKGKEIDKVEFNKILVEHKELIEIAIPVMLDLIQIISVIY